MTTVGALTGSASLLLLVAGIGKVASPAPAVRFLGALGVRLPAVLVRAGAGVEVLVAAAALATGAAWASALVGISYLAFAAAVAAGLRSGSTVGACGCFGGGDRGPTRVHLVIDLGFGALALAAAATTSQSLVAAATAGSLVQAVLVAMSLLVAWLAYVAIVSLPVRAAIRDRDTAQVV